MFELFKPVISRPAREEAERALAHRFKGDLIEKPIPQRERRFSEAGFAGWRAGQDVSLNHGVTASAKPLAIGRRS